jgi:hypothetical protein
LISFRLHAIVACNLIDRAENRRSPDTFALFGDGRGAPEQASADVTP